MFRACAGNRALSANQSEQDREDVLSLYETLENEIVPMFYDRDEHDIPNQWIQKMNKSISSSLWNFSSVRMLKEYVQILYTNQNEEPI